MTRNSASHCIPASQTTLLKDVEKNVLQENSNVFGRKFGAPDLTTPAAKAKAMFAWVPRGKLKVCKSKPDTQTAAGKLKRP